MNFFLYELLPTILNMSITGSIVIIAILAIRLLLKKAPKIFSYAIWAVVLFRLLCPLTFESTIGFLPSTQPIPVDIIHEEYPSVDLPLPIINDVINENLPQGEEQLTSDPLEGPMAIASFMWVIGVFAMLVYSVVQYTLLKRKLIGTKPLRENIYLADAINSPFVMGLFKPKIYLPSSLAKSEYDFIIAHEKCHIKRLDHITRILSFIALALHWFNPLVWVAYIVSAKDMEMSCDEAVMKNMDSDIRAEYSTSLLRLATGKKLIFATPLAFGEGDTKGRVKNVMKYKKPMVWVSAVCLVVVLIVVVAFVTNQGDDGFTNAGGIEPIPAMITEIDRENHTMKVEALENNSVLTPSTTLDVKNATFTNEGKESSIENFSVGYNIDVYVNLANVDDGTMFPLMISMSGTSFEVVDNAGGEIDTIQVILAGGNPAFGNKSKIITDPTEVSEIVNALDTFVVNEDEEVELEVSMPSYYRLYDGDELIEEYMFNGNDTNKMWIGQFVKHIEYEESSPYELYEQSTAEEFVSYQSNEYTQAVGLAKEYVKDTVENRIIDHAQPEIQKNTINSTYEIFDLETKKAVDISGKTVYEVIFATEDDDILGPIVCYVDATELIVLGIGLRM